jgi:transcriptional regulator with XRE-family HTH domain
MGVFCRMAKGKKMPTSLPPIVGECIRNARKRRRLTQARCAKIAGVSRRHLAAMERGSNITVLVLIKIAQAVGLSDISTGALTLHFTPDERLARVTEALAGAADHISIARELAERAREAIQDGGPLDDETR